MEKHIPKVVGSWLAGTYDRDRAVARAATDGINSFLDTDAKVAIFWKRCQVQILDYAQEAIDETPQSLSDERTMNADDIQAKYFRVIGSSISLVINLLVKLSSDEIFKHQDKYQEFLANNNKLWALAFCEDTFVRRTTDQLLMACLGKQREIIESDLEIVSHAFIAEGLRASQTSSALQLVQALGNLTSKFPQVWTSAYKGKKAPLSRLCRFIEKGSQGGPSEYWQALRSLLLLLPPGVLPTDTNSSLEFLKAFRDGICNREELRNNLAEGWANYLDVAKIVVGNLPDSTARAKLFQESIYPIFGQYLHPSTENSRWSIGSNTAALATAYKACASAKDASLQKSFADEWTRLADDFISRILTSLPEQSKDYHKSQTAVAAEGHRWFGLLSKTLDESPFNDSNKFLILPSEKIVTAALKATVNRNGKPYSAAATVESALRLSPALMEVSVTSLESVKTFLETHLPKLMLSPSSSYLVSIMNLLRSVPDQEAFFEDVWQSAIDGLLPLPNDDDKLKAITRLVSNEAVARLSQADSELQDFLLQASTKVVFGDNEAWPLFESVTAFNSLSDSTEAKLVDQVLGRLNPKDSNADSVFKALEVISQKKPDLLRRDASTHVALITKLLAMTELSDSPFAARAEALKAVIENSRNSAQTTQNESPILHVIRENLETASPQSLRYTFGTSFNLLSSYLFLSSIETLVQQAIPALTAATTSEQVASLFPNPAQWSAGLLPLSEQPPTPALAVMRPFAGAVFAANKPSTERNIRKAPRDINGYSIPLRMAIYTANLVSEDKFALLSRDIQAELLYLLLLTVELASDQIDLAEDKKLFGSHLDPEALVDVRDFMSVAQLCLASIIQNAGAWREDSKKDSPDDTSALARELIAKFLSVASTSTSTGFYAAKALSHLFPKLVDAHGWQTVGSEEWLTNLGILKTATSNGLGAVAVLTGLQDVLTGSKVVNNLCNRLISDIAGASAQADKTLGLLILLNASLAVYDEGDLPVAQNRIVFAVKQILSWTPSLATTDSQLTSEACRALQTLLPAMKEVYGSYWETSLNFCISIWESTTSDLTAQSLPMIGMALKLFTVLRNLKDANDDLEDALTFSNEQISQCLVKLLKLKRSKDSQPLEFVDDLLSCNVKEMPIKHVKDLSGFYALVASDFRAIQSAAFDVLHKVIPEVQQQISVDILLEKTGKYRSISPWHIY